LEIRASAVSATVNNVDATLRRASIGTPIPLLWKAVFIGCVIALATLAWLPANAMTRTTLGGHAEHLIAYLSTAMVMGLANRTTPRLIAQSLLLIGYAAILEAGQLYAIGRQASLQDFAFSSSGVLIGTTLAWIVRICWVRETRAHRVF
jgi:VanZ family protein